MTRLLATLALLALVLGVATTALAEGGTIDPFTRTRIAGARPMEGGTIDPFSR